MLPYYWFFVLLKNQCSEKGTQIYYLLEIYDELAVPTIGLLYGLPLRARGVGHVYPA